MMRHAIPIALLVFFALLNIPFALDGYTFNAFALGFVLMQLVHSIKDAVAEAGIPR